jgi:hypothetical protein
LTNPNPKSIDEIDEKDRLPELNRNQRMDICGSCEKLSVLKFCKECHCLMPVKTYLSFAECPLGKW